MNAVELTGILGVFVALLGSVGIPVYLDKRRTRREEARLIAKRAADLEDDTEVSWEAINRALVRERDRLEKRLSEQAAAHTDEIRRLREEHNSEISSVRETMQRDADDMRRRLDAEAHEMKQRYDKEIADLRSRLETCQGKVRELYQELYELQRRMPPGPPIPPLSPHDS